MDGQRPAQTPVGASGLVAVPSALSQPFLATSERDAGSKRRVDELPDLTERIQDLGLMEEYIAFKDRYLAWRKGDPTGAKGEMTVDRITRPEHVAANRGFGFWYPSVQEWLWRRTISYWIAVTFFEGAIFFTISSFLFNYPDELGAFFEPLTLYGYCAGKVLFLICCYFMCLEVVNLHTDDSAHAAKEDGREDIALNKCVQADVPAFFFWPYRCRTALEKLESVGAGPWPYYAASLYLTGVLSFTVGLVAELTPGVPKDVEALVLNWSFLAGALLFLTGAVAECIQNKVFTSLDFHKGWFGAFFNLLGGICFTIGAILAWSDSQASCNMYGYGSAIYVVSSSIQIIMWKDEQFGLTFLAVLNHIGTTGGLATLAGGPAEQQQKQQQHSGTFSIWGALFVHVYCWCGAMSTYNFNIELMRYLEQDSWRSFQYAFNEFLPGLFVHLMLALNSAVLRTPKVAPFRQLYICSRIIALVLAVNSTFTFYQFLNHKIQQ